MLALTDEKALPTPCSTIVAPSSFRNKVSRIRAYTEPLLWHSKRDATPERPGVYYRVGRLTKTSSYTTVMR